jgi:hypothetical protein
MSNIANQMQAVMDKRFTVTRLEVLTKKTEAIMLAAAERIEKRPSLPGCDALEKTQSHSLVLRDKDDAGATFLNSAVSIPGLSATMDTALDISEETYGKRKATFDRSQDRLELSEKEECQIRTENQNDLELFFNMEQRLMQLQAFQSCRVEAVRIDTENDTLIPWEGMATPQYDMKMTPEEHEEMREALKFASKKAVSGPKPMGQ